MKLGAEPKKLAILGTLLVVAAVLFYVNLSGDAGPEELAALPKMTPVTPVARSGAPAPAAPAPASREARRPREFRPSVRHPAEQPLDPEKVDPTLRLELLEKLHNVTLRGAGRNIFEFAAPPPPPPSARPPEPKIIPRPANAPPPVEIAQPVDPPKPQAPPIPLKFYGFISTPRGAERRAFFLDGEEIVVAAEGDTIKSRYKVLRIGLNSVEMEDLQFQQRQTLRLEEQRG
jgi:outer membrane biosynthesis protein TonB